MAKFNLNSNWTQYPVVVFDTETSGPYALEAEIIELGAVKWFEGKIVDKFQVLLKPRHLLKEDNIRIHGITNEMLENASSMKDQISHFRQFIEGSILMAHHAPFDLGFLTIALEQNNLSYPETLNVCTSLLSRSLLHTTNHKLQTLIKELGLVGGSAHRAYDDAYASFQVFQKCMEKILPDQSLNRILSIQAKNLSWDNYAVFSSLDQKLKFLAQACLQEKTISIFYTAGQTKGKSRKITPKGMVRNPDGDYINAFCHIDQQRKRFYIDKIQIESNYEFDC